MSDKRFEVINFGVEHGDHGVAERQADDILKVITKWESRDTAVMAAERLNSVNEKREAA